MLSGSGGNQEETTIPRVTCLTLRDNTERPVAVTHATNHFIDSRPGQVVEAALAVIAAEIVR